MKIIMNSCLGDYFYKDNKRRKVNVILILLIIILDCISYYNYVEFEVNQHLQNMEQLDVKMKKNNMFQIILYMDLSEYLIETDEEEAGLLIKEQLRIPENYQNSIKSSLIILKHYVDSDILDNKVVEEYMSKITNLANTNKVIYKDFDSEKNKYLYYSNKVIYQFLTSVHLNLYKYYTIFCHLVQ